MENIEQKKIKLITTHGDKFTIFLPLNCKFYDFNNLLYKNWKVIKNNIKNFYFVKYIDINNDIITNYNFDINNCEYVKVIFIKMPFL